jgi:thiamine-phosphate pyrophosphorylase
MSPQDHIAVLRIIDAAANRASEGLRVVEDYVRLALDDKFLAKHCKELRHQLQAALAPIAMSDRLAARESQQDVGASLIAAGEMQRSEPEDVVAASFSRAQQAVRSLEEYVKLIDTNAATGLERVRFGLYTLQRAVSATSEGRSRLANVRLYVLVSVRESPEQFASLVQSLAEAGVGAIQLRDKRASDRRLIQYARTLVEMARPRGVISIVNDRADIAALAHADGVHVGQDELSVKDARTIVGPRGLVGVSTHSIEQARQAVLDGANYIGVGPTFPSATKSFDEFPGLDFVRQATAEISLPAFAIGGIALDNASLVLAAGATRLAVSSAIENANHPGDAARAFRALLFND